MNLTTEPNRAIGWSCCAVGVGFGLVLGLWSFDGPLAPPALLVDYGATPRRLLRLAHIALIALGMLNVLYAREAAGLQLRERTRRVAGLLLAIGNLALPITLVLAALWAPGKYLLGPPALAVLIGLGLTAIGTLKPRCHATTAKATTHGLAQASR